MSRVAIVATDLIIATRIGEAARAAGHHVMRVDDPEGLPPASDVDVAFVDWASRGDNWAAALTKWSAQAPPDEAPRLLLFGSHRDLAAHAAARQAGLGPMVARSKLIVDLPDLMRALPPASADDRR